MRQPFSKVEMVDRSTRTRVLRNAGNWSHSKETHNGVHRSLAALKRTACFTCAAISSSCAGRSSGKTVGSAEGL